MNINKKNLSLYKVYSLNILRSQCTVLNIIYYTTIICINFHNIVAPFVKFQHPTDRVNGSLNAATCLLYTNFIDQAERNIYLNSNLFAVVWNFQTKISEMVDRVTRF